MTKATLKLPRPPQDLITTPAALAEVCQHLRAARVFGFDVECDTRPSYAPRLCLVQVATDERVELLDPLALEDLQPLWELLADPAVEKICHAGEQDLAVAWQLGRRQAENVFDSQIAAGLVGIGHQEGYSRLVELFAGKKLGKKETRSAWHLRPLTPAQIAYAVDDVRYLPEIRRTLRGRLKALGRTSWMRDACHQACVKAATDMDPALLFAELPGVSRLQPRRQSVLRELAILRDRIACERREPIRWTLDDKALLTLAQREPETASQLRGIVTHQVVDRYGRRILEAIRHGRELPPDQWPRVAPPQEDSAETKRLMDIMYSASQVILLGQSVSPGVVASRKQIEGLARLMSHGEDLSGHPLMSGWTRECLGAPLVEFLRGETDVTLHATPERLVATFEPRDEGAARPPRHDADETPTGEPHKMPKNTSLFSPMQYIDRLYEQNEPELAFKATNVDEWKKWRKKLKAKVWELLGGMDEPKCDLEAKVVSREQMDGYVRERVLYTTRPGMLVPSWVLIPDGLPAPAPAAIAISGHGHGKDDLVGLDEQGQPRTGPSYQNDFAIQMVRRGFVTIAPEQLGFGERRDPWDIEKGPGCSCQQHSMAAMLFGRTNSGFRVYDTMRAVDYLQSRAEVDPKRIGALGISGGGLVTLFSAAMDERIQACLVSGYFNLFRDCIMTILHCVDNYIPHLLEVAEMCDVASLVAPRAFFSESGTKDTIFPIKATRESFKRLQQVYDLLGLPDKCGLHVFDDEHVFNGKKGIPFLEKWV